MTPHGVEQGISDHPFFADQVGGDLSVGELLDAFDFFIQPQGRAVIAQVIHKGFHHFGVGKLQQSRPLLHDDYAHAQGGEHAGVLHTDNSAAYYDEGARDLRHAEDLIAADNISSVYGNLEIHSRLGSSGDHYE